MRSTSMIALAVLLAPTSVVGQQIVTVPQSQAQVSRPDDLFTLPAGQWQFARRLWDANARAPCTPTECEGGYTAGELVISTERSGNFVRIVAGFRNCQAVGHSEVEVGSKPGKSESRRLREQVERVVKGVAKTCRLSAPAVASFDAAQLLVPRPG